MQRIQEVVLNIETIYFQEKTIYFTPSAKNDTIFLQLFTIFFQFRFFQFRFFQLSY